MDQAAFFALLGSDARVVVADGLEAKFDPEGEGLILFQGDQRIALDAAQFGALWRVMSGFLSLGEVDTPTV